MNLQNSRYPLLLLACLLTIILAVSVAKANDITSTDQAVATAIELYQTGQYQEAQNAFKALHEKDTGPHPPYYLALLQQQQGNLESAAEYMEEAAEIDPMNSVYQQKLGEFYGTQAGNASVFKKMGLAKQSRASFEKAVELDGSNLDARSGLLTYYLQAPAIVGGSEDKALEQAQEIYRQDPARGHSARAQIYQQQGNLEAVEREYRAAIESAPGEHNPWLALGIFLTGQERYDDALALYRERLSAVPDDMPITYQLGRTVSISGQSLDEGRAAFERYISGYRPAPDDPGLDWAHYRLGLIYLEMGEKEAARLEFKESLAINADHPESGKALKKLR